MKLEQFYFGDPRLVLVPIEHLTPSGISTEMAAVLERSQGWSGEKIDLFERGFSLYWKRAEKLSRLTRTWPAPRLRNVAVLDTAETIPPFVQLLNTSTWTLYDCDLDPQTSHPELFAYLLAHGDRMVVTGEVTTAAVHNAAYWFDRSEEEIAAFRRAARQSRRPDAESFAALAEALDWLVELAHEVLRPAPTRVGYRAIPGSGLLVPRRHETAPPALVSTWKQVGEAALRRYIDAGRSPDREAQSSLLEWLAGTAPQLLVTGKNNRVLWDPAQPDRLGRVRSEIRHAGGAALRDIGLDLRIIDARTRAFLDAVREPQSLPNPDESIGQDGYAYLYRGRKILAYNLYEPELRRLETPALPFARAMLGARAAHEWCHLAVDAGWVDAVIERADLRERLDRLVRSFDEIIERQPTARRAQIESDLDALRAEQKNHLLAAEDDDAAYLGSETGGSALVRMILPRLVDYRANLLAVRFQTEEEREVYVRQNIRTLRQDYQPAGVFRMLVRYLYELQYMRFSAVDDGRTFFVRSTWFDTDFFQTGILDEGEFDLLVRDVKAVCESYRVDESRFKR
jgi:hypothetical protein